MPFFDGPDWAHDLAEEKCRDGTVTAFPHIVRCSQIPYLRGENSAVETLYLKKNKRNQTEYRVRSNVTEGTDKLNIEYPLSYVIM